LSKPPGSDEPSHQAPPAEAVAEKNRDVNLAGLQRQNETGLVEPDAFTPWPIEGVTGVAAKYLESVHEHGRDVAEAEVEGHVAGRGAFTVIRATAAITRLLSGTLR
jgi:hypothetical protein